MHLLVFCVLGLFACKKNTTISPTIPPIEEPKKEVVLLVSIDGFRHDYFDFTATPNLDKIIEEGVKAEALIPVFPTKTFPNHYTQVTGLYPENHGLVSNIMYDPEFNERFVIGNGSETVKEGKWYEGEPIWVTANKNGLKSASYYWVGSEAEIGGVRPDYYKTFDSTVPYTERVEEVLNWLNMEEAMRPRFISLYFSLIDSQGHRNGPNPAILKSSIDSIDQTIGRLIQGIATQEKEDLVNLIIVSDHGMAQLSRDSMIFLDDYIDMDDVTVLNWSPNLDIFPISGKLESVHQALKGAHPKLTVYKKEEVPASLHYKNHQRVTPIVGYAENGWSIATRPVFEQYPDSWKGGAHGYHQDHKDMHGIFIAKGPSFKSAYTDKAFSSIHLYELMCEILDIPAAANDGDLKETERFLK